MHLQDEHVLRERIEKRLKDIGISQAEAARRSGLSPSWLNDLLRGRKKGVQAQNLLKVAEGLGTTSSYLLGQTDDPTPEWLLSPSLREMMEVNIEEEWEDPDLASLPPFTHRFLMPGLMRDWRVHWGVLGHDRLPLIRDPARNWPGAVSLDAHGLPSHTASVPQVEQRPGAYAVLVADQSMTPVAPPGWLAYALPSYPPFRSNVIIGFRHEGQMLFLFRHLIALDTETVKTTPLLSEEPEVWKTEDCICVHAVVAVGRNPDP